MSHLYSIFAIVTLTTTAIPSAQAEIESQIPVGLEAVTGLRTEYVHRGFKLAQQTLDFQLEGEVTLDDNLYLGYGAWYAGETGDGNFSETGAKLSLTQIFNAWQWKNSITYRELRNSTFDSGIDLQSKVTYFLAESANNSHAISALASYDSGADGIYGAVEYSYYQALDRSSYISFNLGVSATHDYYGRNGGNDVYSKLSYTYNATKQVSLTPFIGTSLQLDDKNGSDHLFGGLWFEVSF